jgi:DUF4097 and DUF4098 domain-containing protein YvlB
MLLPLLALLAAADASHVARAERFAIAPVTPDALLLAADDDHTAPRNATVDASGARLVRISARAGFLKVNGREGLSQARVRGTARASREGWLDEIQLRAERRGDVVEIDVEIEDRNYVGVGNFYRALDLDIEIPAGIAVEIDDSSGDLEVRGTGALDVRDSSGEIEIVDAGAVRVRDSSGDISIERAKGTVTVEDSSGDIEIRNVAGSVEIEEDSSGDIVAADVTGSVRVGRDSSGSIRVADVGGSFSVERDGSGSISHRNVRGEVQLPRRKRDRADY